MTKELTTYPESQQGVPYKSPIKNITLLSLDGVRKRLQMEQDLEDAIVRNHPDVISNEGRLKHDSISRLLDLARAVTKIGNNENYTISDTVRDILRIDIKGIQSEIYAFQSSDTTSEHRILLNDIGVLLGKILGIKSTTDVSQWPEIFNKLGINQLKKAA